MPLGPFTFSFFGVGALSFIFTVASISLPLYETTYSGPLGWRTSLWQTCLRSETADGSSPPCKRIDESSLPCESLGHVLRTARAFGILAILGCVVQVVLAVVYIFGFLKFLSRFPFIIVTAANFVLLLISWVSMVALYTQKQCSQSRRSASEISFVRMAVGPPLMIIASLLELLMFFATMLWPKQWYDMSGDEMIFTGLDPEIVEAERKANEKKYGVKHAVVKDADEDKDDDKKKDDKKGK